MKLTLIDKNNTNKAEIIVDSFKDNIVLGTIVSYVFETELKQQIKEFEELVNSFCIRELLDNITEQLDAYNWQVVGEDWMIFDFLVFDLKDISFRIKKSNVFSSMDFIAELEFLTTEQGGRKTAVASGYRPHIEFSEYPKRITSGQQTYIGQATAKPRETVKSEISIISKDYFEKRLYKNMKFTFSEGGNTIGYGKILEIVNLKLKRYV